MMLQKLINITMANNFHEKWQQYNMTAETLMQLSFSIWDLLLAFFNQVFFFYNEIIARFKLTHTDEIHQKWTQLNEQYKLIDTALALFTQSLSVLESVSGYLVRAFNNLIVVIVDFVKDLPNQIPSPHEMQQKWSQINQQYQVTHTVVALFTQFLSALESIYVYLIRAYNNRDWILAVARNQMVALTDTTTDILRKLKTLVEFLVNVFNYILPPEKRGDQIPEWLYLGGYFVILVVLLTVCIRNLGPGGKTMKAPGKPNRVISRAAFEGNPRKYFADHRRKR